MNKAILIGNLTKDPDLRTTGSGTSVCTFSIAVQRRFANQNGEKQADFLNIVCWRGLAETCGKYLQKGKKVGVSGSIQTRTYDDNDGKRQYFTEIVADEVEFLSNRNEGGGGGDQSRIPGPEEPAASPFGNATSDFGEMLDDSELPF